MKRIIVKRGPARLPGYGPRQHATGEEREAGGCASGESAYERMFAGALLCLEQTSYLDILLSGGEPSGGSVAPRPRKAGG